MGCFSWGLRSWFRRSKGLYIDTENTGLEKRRQPGAAIVMKFCLALLRTTVEGSSADFFGIGRLIHSEFYIDVS